MTGQKNDIESDVIDCVPNCSPTTLQLMQGIGIKLDKYHWCEHIPKLV